MDKVLGPYRKAVALLCVLIVCVILTAGLWPFLAPRNSVHWLQTGDGLQFGKHGTAVSAAAFRKRDEDNASGTLEIALKAARSQNEWGTILSFAEFGPSRRAILAASVWKLFSRSPEQYRCQRHLQDRAHIGARSLSGEPAAAFPHLCVECPRYVDLRQRHSDLCFSAFRNTERSDGPASPGEFSDRAQQLARRNHQVSNLWARTHRWADC